MLGCPFNISPTLPNPTIFTQIESIVFKFSISLFYTFILQGTTLSLPPILFVLQICEHYEGRSFMSNPPQAQRIIKCHLKFFTRLTLSLTLSLKLKELSNATLSSLLVSLFHSLSLSYIFFSLDFSSKFVWHKNFEGVSIFFF